MTTETKDTVRSIMRAFQILECFSIDKTELSISDLFLLTKLKKSTIFRILATLTELGYIQQNINTQKYFLSRKLYYMGINAFRDVDLRTISLPLLNELSQQINETIGLNIMEKYDRVCIEMVESRELIRGILRLGERIPLTLGAAGRVMVAYLPEERQKEIIAYSLNTLNINEGYLNKKLEEIRQEGYEASVDERVSGAFSVSSPIFDHNSQVIGSINACGPMQRWNEERISLLIERVKSTARKISEAMGYIAGDF